MMAFQLTGFFGKSSLRAFTEASSVSGETSWNSSYKVRISTAEDISCVELNKLNFKGNCRKRCGKVASNADPVATSRNAALNYKQKSTTGIDFQGTIEATGVFILESCNANLSMIAICIEASI
jgi:hypothetical protein